MKKFKHKKTGDIATYKNGVLKSSGFCVEIGVEPSSEFWEEVVEKDYEILSLSTNVFTGITTSKIDINAFLEKAIGTEKWTINSVLRKSDNCVFIIGDDVKLKNNSLSFKINKFDINVHDNSKLLISSFENTFICNLNAIEKFKPVLFTTEDGVDIYEGDIYYRIISNWQIQEENAVKKGLETYYKDGIPRFSSRETAVQYIIYNKPCLSINDVTKNLEAFKNNKFILNELKELVKSKL